MAAEEQASPVPGTHVDGQQPNALLCAGPDKTPREKKIVEETFLKRLSEPNLPFDCHSQVVN
jgi:hypothetical protein